MSIRPDAAIAALRIFYGVVFLANGAAKLMGGSWFTSLGFLYDRNTSLALLRESVADHPIPVYRDLTQAVINAWEVAAPLIGLGEVVLGVLLVVGLAPRAAAVVGVLFGLNLQVLALSGGGWLFQHALVWLPLLVVAWSGGGSRYAVHLRLGRSNDTR
jgi:uncharacterized membrane protein YphA (DoxX/SURF4 family)